MIYAPPQRSLKWFCKLRRSCMRKSFLAVLLLAFCPPLVAQQALNNDAIIKLVKAGLSDDLIVTTINASPGSYDASANGLIALKKANVSDKVDRKSTRLNSS